jgi:succinate dehydrogenase/fumarate reductase flavoprotein subunit
MRRSQPNFFVPFDRLKIDPFTQHFPVTLRLEGTVRGTGGLHVIDADCATSVSGLYAAGDAATRELICGGFTGGGSHNAAWAMSSGFWAGAGAADHARAVGALRTPRTVLRAGGAALHDGPSNAAIDSAALVRAVQAEVLPTQRNWTRRVDQLEDSLSRLDALWRQVRAASASERKEAVRAREAVAMLAVSRWMYRSALARTETRGMARRADHPAADPAQRHRLLSGGLDEVWVTPHAVGNEIREDVAA